MKNQPSKLCNEVGECILTIDGIEQIQYITEDCIHTDDHSKHGAFKYPDHTNNSILLPKGDIVSINNETKIMKIVIVE